MEKDITFWAAVVGIPGALSTIFIATMRGMFVTKSECLGQSSRCVSGIKDELQEIKEALETGNRKFKNTERYIIALADKAGVRPGDIPEL